MFPLADVGMLTYYSISYPMPLLVSFAKTKQAGLRATVQLVNVAVVNYPAEQDDSGYANEMNKTQR